MSARSTVHDGVPEFLILTGALGSGKTTLLKDFLTLPESGTTAIIVNDAGDINVDGAILEDVEGRRVTRAANGCICCSIGDDLQEAVDTVIARHEEAGTRVERIILETSGLAEPAPIVRSVGRLRQDRFKLGIVVTLDACRAGGENDHLPQYAAQLAAAQSIVITKVDLCDVESLACAREHAGSLNPLASTLAVHDRTERARSAFSRDAIPAPAAIPAFHASPTTSNPRIRVILAKWTPTPAWPTIEEWIENIVGFCGDRLLRMKGVLAPEGYDRDILINAVGPAFGRPQPVAKGISEEGLVLIVRDLDEDELAAFSKGVSPSPPKLVARGVA